MVEALHRSRYRRPVRVIKVSLSESVSPDLIKFSVERNLEWPFRKMTCKPRRARNRDCVLWGLSILNPASGQLATLENSALYLEARNTAVYQRFTIRLYLYSWTYSMDLFGCHSRFGDSIGLKRTDITRAHIYVCALGRFCQFRFGNERSATIIEQREATRFANQ